MKETDARLLTFIRAVESTDYEQDLLQQGDREHAIHVARKSIAHSGREGERHETFLVQRAEVLFERLARRNPAMEKVLRIAEWPRWVSIGLPFAGLFLGLAASELTSDRRINLIAFPLAGMLLWNLVVYLLLLAQQFRNRASAEGASAGFAFLVRGRKKLAERSDGELSARNAMAAGIARFTEDWLRNAHGLFNHRMQAALHLSAVGFAIGIVGGMYLSALALEYRAGWESTFLDEVDLHRGLTWLLGPASWLTGIAIPNPDALRSLRWGPDQTGGNGADWIHLYAATALLFIVVPRLILWAAHGHRARRLAGNFPLAVGSDPYYLRLLRPLELAAGEVCIVPYSYHPSDAVRKSLAEIIASSFGPQMRIKFQTPIPYGAEDDAVSTFSQAGNLPSAILLLFNLGATPEQENHGAFIDGMQRLVRSQGQGTQLGIILDESSYRRKAALQGAEGRLTSRRATWNDMLQRLDAEAAMLDLETDNVTDMAEQMEAILWSPMQR